MRLKKPLLATAALAALASLAPLAGAQAPAPGAPANPSPDDILGNIVVVAGQGAGRRLPKVAVYPSLASEMEDVTLRAVVGRDLDLCGEFEVLADKSAPESAYGDGPVDVKAWSAKGVEALVRVSAKKLGTDRVELRGQAFFTNRGADPVYDKRFSVLAASLREESHRLADLLIGALTGQNGSFASHLAFGSGGGAGRRVFTIDADGHDPRAASPEGESAIAPAFGKNGELYYASARATGDYLIHHAGGAVAPMNYKAPVYGLAFSRDHAQVAVSLGAGDTIKVFAGPDLASLRPASEVGMAMHPAFTPSGKLAFSGEGKSGTQRIFIDDKPVTPEGLSASSPVFCNNQDGVRLLFAVGVGKNTDLVTTSERGGQLVRLTQNQGRNSYPACSPDGRLVAFFSTRTSGEGPGLYVMRIDGGRPKRVSPMLGDTLRWDALPKGSAVELKD